MSGNFTCVTCRVQYGDGEAQRLHYKSDWHRYNLKRKVASLPPVTEAFFFEKSSKLSTVKATKSENASTLLRCALCNKNFATDNSLQSHLLSKKHKEAVSCSAIKKSVSTVDGDNLSSTIPADSKVTLAVEEDFIVKIVKKSTVEDKARKNRNAMESRDKRAKLVALRINKAKAEDDDEENDEEDDEWESDDDDENDGEYDGDESLEGEAMDDEESELPFGDGEAIPNTSCLFCSSNSSATVEENLKHMSSSHSFFIPDLDYLVDMEGLLTYLGEKVGCGFLCLWCNEKGKAFHNVDSAQAHMRDKGHSKMLHEGDALFEYADFYDYRPSYPDYDPDKASDTDMEVECGSKASQDEEVNVEEVDGDGYTLVLPSGATVGHRSLLRYYKQSLNPRFHSSNAIVAKHRTAVQKLMSHYKALGWAGCTGEAAKVKAKDIQFAQKAFHKNRMQIGVKANKLQHHYREQVMY